MYRLLLFCAVLWGVAVSPARSTVLVPMNTEDLTRRADLVVVGKVQAVLARVEGEQAPSFSYVVVSVTETLKGPKTAAVTLKLLGGQTGDDPKTARMAGVPKFLPGEPTVLFLSSRPEESARYYNVVGWSQGKLGLADSDTLQDGRKLPALKEEVRKHAGKPGPEVHRRKSAHVLPPSHGVKGPVVVKPLTARQPPPARKKTVATGVEDDPGRPPLSSGERMKLDEMKRGKTR
jgi:hypothetical protein